MPDCEVCGVSRAAVKRPKTGQKVCKQCFFALFEAEIHNTIVENHLFKRGEKVVIGASGGKDSTVLIHTLELLNRRHDYGIELILLSIDEGITGYRDDSLETVKRNEAQYGLPLTILSYKDLYDWSMDEIVAQIGQKSNCTFCGVFRRQALDRGAAKLGADKVVTGHNADDIAETVLMNIMRGDVSRLERCTNITTDFSEEMPRCKPFKYTYEKEIVMYAHFLQLDYFSTECTYSPGAFRGFARTFLKDLEVIRPRAILDLILSGETFQTKKNTKKPTLGVCEQCGYLSSQRICKACDLLAGLNQGKAELSIEMDAPPQGSIHTPVPKEQRDAVRKRILKRFGGSAGGKARRKEKQKKSPTTNTTTSSTTTAAAQDAEGCGGGVPGQLYDF